MKHRSQLKKACGHARISCGYLWSQLHKTNQALHFDESPVKIFSTSKFTTGCNSIAGRSGIKDICLLKFNTYGNLQQQKFFSGSGLYNSDHIADTIDRSDLMTASRYFPGSKNNIFRKHISGIRIPFKILYNYETIII